MSTPPQIDPLMVIVSQGKHDFLDDPMIFRAELSSDVPCVKLAGQVDGLAE